MPRPTSWFLRRARRAQPRRFAAALRRRLHVEALVVVARLAAVDLHLVPAGGRATGHVDAAAALRVLDGVDTGLRVGNELPLLIHLARAVPGPQARPVPAVPGVVQALVGGRLHRQLVVAVAHRDEVELLEVGDAAQLLEGGAVRGAATGDTQGQRAVRGRLNRVDAREAAAGGGGRRRRGRGGGHRVGHHGGGAGGAGQQAVSRRVSPHRDDVVPAVAGLVAVVLVRVVLRGAVVLAVAGAREGVRVGGAALTRADAARDHAHVEVLAVAVVHRRRAGEDVAEERALLLRVAGALAPAERGAVAVQPQTDVDARRVHVGQDAGADLLLAGLIAGAVGPLGRHAQLARKRQRVAASVLQRDGLGGR